MTREPFPFRNHWTQREVMLIENFRSDFADHHIITLSRSRKIVPTRCTSEVIAYIGRNARRRDVAA